MGRAPCCEKTGLKKGPWSPEEDRILMSYVQKHGHANWRALPKQAGLLRCGKSCRLRWINYLRPDIKRGNFTKEEEESIIKLHEMLGNRWSAIAARLPGRTDNEIKNVWHTHLKKRLNKQNQDNINPEAKQSPNTLTKCDSNNSILTTATTTTRTQSESENSTNDFHSHPTSSNSSSVSSPHPSSSSEVSSSIDTFNSLTNGAGVHESHHHVGVKTEQTDNCNNSDEKDNLLEIDDSFWSETLSSDDHNTITSLTSGETNQMDIILENLPEIDQSFWSDEFSSTSTADNINSSSSMPLDFGGANVADQLQQIGSPFISIDDYMVEPILNNDGYIHPQVGNGDDDNGMDFWYNVFVNSSGESIQPLF